MVKKGWLLVILSVIMLNGCMEINDQPDFYERTTDVSFFIKLDTTGHSQLLSDIPVMANVPVTITTLVYADFEITGLTNDSGWVYFNDLPNANYSVKVRVDFDFQNDLDVLTLTGSDIFSVAKGNSVLSDTLNLIMSGKPGLKINEIYYMGPPNRIFYFYDQFIELYNSSDQTMYLDGMIVCRMGTCVVGADNVTYIFQLPGEPLTGREYPIYPGEFKVLAQDARNHVVVQGADTLVRSIDLTSADWEFVNSQDYADSDNPDVPNIGNIETGNRNDFMIALGSDIVLIATGEDVEYSDGIDMETIIDCVEYSSKADHIKDITEELDEGFAGVGMAKYSYQSIERLTPGFDSDNSTIDFQVYNYPTPGFQNE